MLRTTKLIGQGSEKLCYQLEDGRVALFNAHGARALYQEHGDLNRLRNAGIDAYVTDIAEVWIHESDTVEIALVGRKYDRHFLCGQTNVVTEVPRSVRMRAVALLRQMMAQNIFVSDPQFLFDVGGEVVLCDPGRVWSPKGRRERAGEELYAKWAIGKLLGKRK
jgi:hypothetical protein